MKQRSIVIGGAALLTLIAAGGISVTLASRSICHLSDARRMKATADLYAIAYSLEAFRAVHGRVPTTAEGLESVLQSPSGNGLEKIPLDPWWGSYEYVSDGSTYEVFSYGADREPGGENDNADIRINASMFERSNKPVHLTAASGRR